MVFDLIAGFTHFIIKKMVTFYHFSHQSFVVNFLNLFSKISSLGDCITSLQDSCHYSTYATSCDGSSVLSAATCSCSRGFENLFNNTCDGK